MTIPTILTEAAMKGAARRAEHHIFDMRAGFYRVRRWGGDGCWIEEIDFEEKHHATSFIEREGLRASMAWLAEKYHTCDGLLNLRLEDGLIALAGGGEE